MAKEKQAPEVEPKFQADTVATIEATVLDAWQRGRCSSSWETGTRW